MVPMLLIEKKEWMEKGGSDQRGRDFKRASL